MYCCSVFLPEALRCNGVREPSGVTGGVIVEFRDNGKCFLRYVKLTIKDEDGCQGALVFGTAFGCVDPRRVERCSGLYSTITLFVEGGQ